MDILHAIKAHYKPRQLFKEGSLLSSLEYLGIGKEAAKGRLEELQQRKAEPFAPKNVPRPQWTKTLIEAVEGYSERLYRVSCSVAIQSIDVMLSGKRRPLRCTVLLDGTEQKTYYVKIYNINSDPRAQGIALLKVFGLLPQNYAFFFDSQYVIEDHVEGKLGEEISPEEKKLLECQQKAVQFFTTAMLIGLGDLHDNNYIVQRGYNHVPIDFDVMVPYTLEKMEKLHQRIMQEYQLSEKEYRAMLINTEEVIANQLFHQEKHVAKIVNIIGLIKPQLKEYLESTEKYQLIFRR